LDSVLLSDRAYSAGKSQRHLTNRNSAVDIKPAEMATGEFCSLDKKRVTQRSFLHFSGFDASSTRPASQVFQPRQFAKRTSAAQLRALEKRPTFVDGLDKRKSWSVDIRPLRQESEPVMKVAAASGLRNARGQTLQEIQQQQRGGPAMLATTAKG